MSTTKLQSFALAATLSLCVTPALAGPITSKADTAKAAPFDLVETSITAKGDTAVFSIRVRGGAGAEKPKPTGKFEGSEVYSYVWPTSLNSSAVGFEADQGIVALAVTFHPDFDDGAGGAANRDTWHPHWVVLTKDEACGGGLKVRDIPAGTKPKLPTTWPGAPILIDSPSFPTEVGGESVTVEVPLSTLGDIKAVQFDGVTAGLKVNANLHAPLLCVADVFKIASGDLSLPGKVSTP